MVSRRGWVQYNEGVNFVSTMMSLLQIKRFVGRNATPHASSQRRLGSSYENSSKRSLAIVLFEELFVHWIPAFAGMTKVVGRAFARMTVVVVLMLLIGFAAQAKNRTLVVETAAYYPPFTFVEKGQIVGFDIDLINMMAQNLGYALEIKDVEFKDLFVDLKNKDADLAIAAITVTPNRMKDLYFSGRYYFPEFAILHKRKDNIQSVEDLNNKTVAVLSGSTMEEFLTGGLKAGKKLSVRTFNNTQFMLGALNTKEIDAALVEDVTARRAQQEGKFSYFLIKSSRPDGYAIMFQKDSELVDEFNEELVKLKASKQFEELKKKWGI
jgi:polar amino acid transport system substrate-binding protein